MQLSQGIMEDDDYSEGDSVDASIEEFFSIRSSWSRIRENDRHTRYINVKGDDNNMTDEDWEELGRDGANNTHLEVLSLREGALNDHKMSCLFRGLTRSNTIRQVDLYDNHLSTAGVSSMVPFLQNANKLKELDLTDNNIQSEGFNLLLRALRDSPIEGLCRALSVALQLLRLTASTSPNIWKGYL